MWNIQQKGGCKEAVGKGAQQRRVDNKEKDSFFSEMETTGQAIELRSWF